MWQLNTSWCSSNPVQGKHWSASSCMYLHGDCTDIRTRGTRVCYKYIVQILPSPAITITTLINTPLQDPPESVRKCPCFVRVCVCYKLPVNLILSYRYFECSYKLGNTVVEQLLFRCLISMSSHHERKLPTNEGKTSLYMYIS